VKTNPKTAGGENSGSDEMVPVCCPSGHGVLEKCRTQRDALDAAGLIRERLESGCHEVGAYCLFYIGSLESGRRRKWLGMRHAAQYAPRRPHLPAASALWSRAYYP
jgi:hypothetical protein